jgi:hypothetical protein
VSIATTHITCLTARVETCTPLEYLYFTTVLLLFTFLYTPLALIICVTDKK